MMNMKQIHVRENDESHLLNKNRKKINFYLEINDG